MANRWEKMDAMSDFIFLGFKITVDSDCSQEIKRCLLLGRKAITNLDSIFKSRGVTLPRKFHVVKTMVLFNSLIWIWELDHKVEWEWRMDAFELWCWRRLLNSKIKPVQRNTEYSLEGLMLKLKLQYLGHLMWRVNSLGKTLMLGKTEGRRRGWQRMRWLDSITDSMDMNLSKL